jgi:dTDP-4-amino-4,6-dideoxygalactose transaminase
MYIPTFQGLGPADFVRPIQRNAQRFPFDAPHQLRCYRARNAIYYLFRALARGGSDPLVLAPDYNSGNEVLAMRAAGATVRYYPVGRDARMDLDAVERLCRTLQPDVLYVIHYLGWPQPMPEIVELCRRRGLLLVEDCALALLSDLDDRPLGSFGDWSIFCLYKTLPVPNGALLVQNTTRLEALERIGLRRPAVASVAGRTAELLVQRLRSRVNGVGATLQIVKRNAGRVADHLALDRANVGDIGFTIDEVDLAMSGVSSRLLHHLDFETIRRRRRENFELLAERLDGRVAVLQRETAGGVCPLFFPLLVSDKRTAAARLRERGIEALEFWNEGTATAHNDVSPGARFLRAHVLALPVHQDLTVRHMDHIAHPVSRLNVRMAA